MAAVIATIALGSAHAAQSPAIVQVTATIQSVCRVTAGNLAFGAYDPLGLHEASPLDAEVRIFVNCTRAISGALTLLPAHGTPDSAFLVSGTEQLGYSLFQDSARTSLWGGYSTGVGKKRSFEVPVYGRVGAGQDVPDGDYFDSVTVRLDFSTCDYGRAGSRWKNGGSGGSWRDGR